MKAQSAIEYLITYEWMLLAVAIVSGAIYSLVGFGCTDSTSGFQGQNIQVEDFGLTGSEELSLLLRNTDTEQVNITEIRITGDNGKRNVTLDGSDGLLNAADSEQYNFLAFEETQTCNELDVEIVYDLEPLPNQLSEGTINSEILVQEIEDPEPLADLNVSQ